MDAYAPWQWRFLRSRRSIEIVRHVNRLEGKQIRVQCSQWDFLRWLILRCCYMKRCSGVSKQQKKRERKHYALPRSNECNLVMGASKKGKVMHVNK
jgi:hypothetical protein